MMSNRMMIDMGKHLYHGINNRIIIGGATWTYLLLLKMARIAYYKTQ